MYLDNLHSKDYSVTEKEIMLVLKMEKIKDK